ncbi:hypothetical protein H4219_000100 [Mycoemilia scoparia]|uniref:Bromodomain-containing protein n=1 Tax=Mycoemilia scoparia TaxID=417184 RepID=A0A9W8DTG2_9FUNG|nr:hypothetical protein H4219_000100 [Mycoemilia scoparia]
MSTDGQKESVKSPSENKLSPKIGEQSPTGTVTPMKREFSENDNRNPNGNDTASNASQHSIKRARKEPEQQDDDQGGFEPEDAHDKGTKPRPMSPGYYSPMLHGASSTITKEQYKYCVAMMRSLKKHRDAGPFLQPVDHVLLNIPDYPQIIKNPMDLGTVDKKLKSRQYTDVDQFEADLKLIFKNCYLYNGTQSPVSLMAQNIEKMFENQITKMPAKEKHILASRPRESRKSVGPVSPPYPEGSVSESKTKRGPTHGSSPRSRKSHSAMPESIAKFCSSIIKEFKKKSNSHIVYPFLQPVDWVAMNIPDYPQIVKQPMDISTLKRKLDSGEYDNPGAFEADVRLMFNNCYAYNPPKHPVHEAGRSLEAIFDAKWVDLPPMQAQNFSSPSPQRESTPAGAIPEHVINHETSDVDVEEPPKSSQIKDLEKHLEEMHRHLEDLKKSENRRQSTGTGVTGGGVRRKSSINSQTSSRASPTPGYVPEVKRGRGRGRGRGSRGRGGPKTHGDIDLPAESLTFEQKKALSTQIENMEAEKLQVVIDIIKSAYPDLNEDEEEIELDIDSLDKYTLNKLYSYVVLGNSRAVGMGTTAPQSRRVSDYMDSDQTKRSQLEEKLKQLDSVKQLGRSTGDMFATRPTQHYGSSSSENIKKNIGAQLDKLANDKSSPTKKQKVLKLTKALPQERKPSSSSDILMHFKQLKEKEKQLFNRTSKDYSQQNTAGMEEIQRLQDRRQAEEQNAKQRHAEIKERLEELSKNPLNLQYQKQRIVTFEIELFRHTSDAENTEFERQERIRNLLGLPPPPPPAAATTKHHRRGDISVSQPGTPFPNTSPQYIKSLSTSEAHQATASKNQKSQSQPESVVVVVDPDTNSAINDSDLEEGELLE